ncbi:MAG TPA: glutamate--tRNA ligase [Candidatus Methylomirabilis sp.]|nr:glutamate--tRNA ligase [Candidatus Methylomirabilis sp.]
MPQSAPSNIRVRFAPSPTGFLHIGGLRSALYNELLARRHSGTFILRIEDTDQARLVPGATEALVRTLKACGLVPDEGVVLKPNGEVGETGDAGPYIQSKRKEIHRAYADKLIGMGKAYYCFCTERDLQKMREEQQAAALPTRYNRTCRALSLEQATRRVDAGDPYVIRLAIPLKGSVAFDDEIRSNVAFEWKQVDDQVIIKSDGMATYHLANTCDDHDMGITHVIRGEEWISSTPKHLFIYQALGWTPPAFAHLPLLLNADRTKLSKRQGDVAVEDYLTNGYLPEALINFVALLGWNPTGDREIYTHHELAQAFDLTKVNKSGAVVNVEKLDWLNGHYVRTMERERYLELVSPSLQELTQDTSLMDRVAMLIRDRVVKLTDVPNLAGPYLKLVIEPDPLMLPWKSQTKEEAADRLDAILKLLTTLDHDAWHSVESLEQAIKALIEQRGWSNGEALWPLRVALSGERQSPGPFELLYALGRERSLTRVEQALHALHG